MFTHITKRTQINNALRDIDNVAQQYNITPEDAALKVVKQNKKAVEQFVIENGEVPESDARSLAAQALVIHEYKIWQQMQRGVPDYETAENVILAQKQDKEDRGVSANFDGDILGSIFVAGRKALDKINEKRVANGRKPILAGAKGQKLLDKIQTVAPAIVGSKTDSTGKSKTVAGQFIKDVSDDVEKKKTKAAIMKYLPYGILAIIIVFIIGKHYAK